MPEFIRRPDLSELETLVLAADRGSIAAAADALQISRVAASKRLRALEAIAGTQLLTRASSGIELTRAGRRVYAHARSLLDESDALLQTLGLVRLGEQRTISGMDFLIGLADEAGRAPTTHDRLIATERLAAELFHASPVPIAVIDPATGAFEDVNAALCALAGTDRESLLGHTLDQLGIDLHDPEGAYAAMRGTPRDSLTDYKLELTAGGRRHHVAISTFPVRIGEQDRRFCVIHDLSVMRRLDRRLAGMVALGEHIEVPVAIAHADGRLDYANPAFRRLLRLPEEGPLDDVRPRDMVVPGSLSEEESARAALGRGENWRGTLAFAPPGGGEVRVEMIAFPLAEPTSGEYEHVGVVVQGVSAPGA